MAQILVSYCFAVLGSAISSGIAVQRRFPNPYAWGFAGFFAAIFVIPIALVVPSPKNPAPKKDLRPERWAATFAVAGIILYVVISYIIPVAEIEN